MDFVPADPADALLLGLVLGIVLTLVVLKIVKR